MLGVVSQPPKTFPTAKAKSFVHSFMDQHHFQPQKHDLPPKKKLLKSIASIAPKKSTLALSAALEASASRVFTSGPSWRQRFSQWSLEKQPDYCTRIQFQSILVGFFFGRFPGNTFLESYQFGGSENLRVGD